MRYLLDTNALVDLLRGRAGRLADRIRARSPDEIGLSSIVLNELHYGVHRSLQPSRNAARVDGLRFEVVPFDKEDAVASGEIRAALSKAGVTIGAMDVLIAGQAVSRGLVLVTNNLREFRRVPGLAVEDWTAAG